MKSQSPHTLVSRYQQQLEDANLIRQDSSFNYHSDLAMQRKHTMSKKRSYSDNTKHERFVQGKLFPIRTFIFCYLIIKTNTKDLMSGGSGGDINAGPPNVDVSSVCALYTYITYQLWTFRFISINYKNIQCLSTHGRCCRYI